MDYTVQYNSGKFENILMGALKLPGVRVDRKSFLYEILKDNIKNLDIIEKALNINPIEAGIPISQLDKISKTLINKRVTHTSAASFAAGIPGGVAMAATIPMDTLQFLGNAIRLSQELAYLYGYEDFWDGNQINDSKVKRELTLFLGVMFGVGGSASALRVISNNISKQVIKRTSKKALTKTAYYPIVKKIGVIIGVKVTKDSFAKGIAKAVPILGGIVSGGITYASMKPMGNRLRKILSESINYTDKDLERDLIDIENEIVDVDYNEVDIDDRATTLDEIQDDKSLFSEGDELLKFKELLDVGLITREEFDKKKNELIK